MADLITLARAKLNINQSTFSSNEDSTIEALIDGVSKAIGRYCRRQLDLQSLDELHSGTGDTQLLLYEYPIISVTRVISEPEIALRIQNSNSANQRASLRLTSTGLLLTTVASGTTTAETEIAWSSNATITAVKDAVIAKGNGWTAELPSSDYALWPSSELSPPQGKHNTDSTIRPHGALNAAGRWAPLRIWTAEISDYEIDVGRGMLIMEPFGWTPGIRNYRVIYNAGYATVPEDIQEAAAQWVAALFWQTKDNPAVYPDFPTAGIALLLDHYRRHSV